MKHRSRLKPGTDRQPGQDTAPAGSRSSVPLQGAPGVTDHAIVRYLERAYGLDVASVKAEILTGAQAAIDFGAGTVIHHGVRIVIRNGETIITALPKRGRR